MQDGFVQHSISPHRNDPCLMQKASTPSAHHPAGCEALPHPCPHQTHYFGSDLLAPCQSDLQVRSPLDDMIVRHLRKGAHVSVAADKGRALLRGQHQKSCNRACPSDRFMVNITSINLGNGAML